MDLNPRNTNNHRADSDSEVDRLDRVIERFQAEVQHLEAERKTGQQADLDAALRAVEERAARAIAEAQAEAERLDEAGPSNALTETEIQLAGTRAARVKMDAETLAPDLLVRRVGAALAGSDRLELFLWSRYVGIRLERDYGRVRPSPSWHELARLAVALRERLDDSERCTKVQRLRRHIELAKDLTGWVGPRWDDTRFCWEDGQI